MNRSRLLVGAVGVTVFLVGMATVFDPSTAAGIPLDRVTDPLGGPWVFVAAFGVAAFIALVGVMLARAVDGIDEATPPDPEEVYRVPRPGHQFDGFVEGRGSLRQRLFGNRHERVRRRVERTALATLMRSGGMSRREAETALASGTWTDDPVAAAFLSEHRTPGFGQRVVAAARGESPFQHGARRAAMAVASYDEGAR